MGPCEYCSHYINAKERIYLEPTDKKRVRFCIIIGKFVKGSGSCPRFTLNKYQWCKKEARWIALEVCSYKRATKQNHCGNCKQGKEFSELRKMRNNKPLLVSRRKE